MPIVTQIVPIVSWTRRMSSSVAGSQSSRSAIRCMPKPTARESGQFDMRRCLDCVTMKPSQDIQGFADIGCETQAVPVNVHMDELPGVRKRESAAELHCILHGVIRMLQSITHRALVGTCDVDPQRGVDIAAHAVHTERKR